MDSKDEGFASSSQFQGWSHVPRSPLVLSSMLAPIGSQKTNWIDQTSCLPPVEESSEEVLTKLRSGDDFCSHNSMSPIVYGADAQPDGLESGSPNGFGNGSPNGFGNGSPNGFGNGSNNGFESGSNNGFECGSNNGFECGSNNGFEIGSNNGFEIGSNSGYANGSTNGFGNGPSDGFESGPFEEYNGFLNKPRQLCNYTGELGIFNRTLPPPPPSPSTILGLKSKDERLLQLSDRTQYNIVQRNGQRSYGGPPPNWIGSPPPKGSEVFVGKVPRDIYEDELVPIFERIGKIYELRLMMDFSGTNRGFFFVCYTNVQDAKRAIRELDNYEIRPGKFIGVVPSVDNRKLWISGIPLNATAEDVKVDMHRLTEGVKNVVIYPIRGENRKNRGYCYVEYETHRAAALARRRLVPGRVTVLGNEIEVDWAEPEVEVDESIMSKVKILYVRNLTHTTTENQIWELFNQLSSGQVERVKKFNHYAFVHFLTREGAEIALNSVQILISQGLQLEVTWSRPADKNVVGTKKLLMKNSNYSVSCLPRHIASDKFSGGLPATNASGHVFSHANIDNSFFGLANTIAQPSAAYMFGAGPNSQMYGSLGLQGVFQPTGGLGFDPKPSMVEAIATLYQNAAARYNNQQMQPNLFAGDINRPNVFQF